MTKHYDFMKKVRLVIYQVSYAYVAVFVRAIFIYDSSRDQSHINEDPAEK